MANVVLELIRVFISAPRGHLRLRGQNSRTSGVQMPLNFYFTRVMGYNISVNFHFVSILEFLLKFCQEIDTKIFETYFNFFIYSNFDVNCLRMESTFRNKNIFGKASICSSNILVSFNSLGKKSIIKDRVPLVMCNRYVPSR